MVQYCPTLFSNIPIIIFLLSLIYLIHQKRTIRCFDVEKGVYEKKVREFIFSIISLYYYLISIHIWCGSTSQSIFPKLKSKKSPNNVFIILITVSKQFGPRYNAPSCIAIQTLIFFFLLNKSSRFCYFHLSLSLSLSLSLKWILIKLYRISV